MRRQPNTEMVVVTLLIAITTCSLLVYVSTSSDHNLHGQTTVNDNKTLFVTGSATTQTKPDKVTVSLGVETTNAKAKTALATNSELMNKIINALKIAGVSENETSTSSLGLKITGIKAVNIDQATPFFTGPLQYSAESSKIDAGLPAAPIIAGEQEI